MDFKTKKTGGATVEITVKNTPEEVQEAFQSAYEKARARVKIPGFRAGKAPLELVERHLGDSVSSEAAEKLISSTFEKIVDELDPAPINVPSFSVESFNRAEGAVFVGSYETYPEVKLGKYRKLKASKDDASVTDDTVQAEIERLRTEHAQLKTREGEAARSGDYVTIELELLHNNKRLYQNKEARFVVGKADFPPHINENVEGMKIGDDKSYEVAVDADFQDSRFAGKNIVVRIKMHQVMFPEYPELNDEFAKDLGDYNSLEDLRNKIKGSFLEQANGELKNRAMEAVLEQIVADTKIVLPDSMVESEYKNRFEQIKARIGNKNLTEQDVSRLSGQSLESFRNDLKKAAEKAVTDKLILLEISKKEEIAVSNEEVDAEIKNRWSMYVSPDQIDKLVNNAQMREDVKGRLLYRRTLDWIFDNSDIKKGATISYETLRDEGAFN